MEMEGTVSMLPLDPSPPAEMALKLTLAFAVLACRDMEQKPWGLAVLQPAAQGQRELSAVTALPGTLMRVWAGRAEGAGLLLHVPASVSACLPPPRGCWHTVSWHSSALLWGGGRAVLGEPSMALWMQSLGADSALVFLGFPGITLSCPGLS